MTGPAPTALTGRRLLLALLSVFGLAVAVFANSLQNDFAYDDEPIIALNEEVHGIDRLGDAITGAYWPGGLAERGLYRPLTQATYAVDWEVGDGDPMVFHAVNVLLHGLTTALVLLLLLRLGAAPLPAWIGAAVFAVHPVHVEAVANVVGRAEILTTLFVLSACLLYLRTDRRRWGTALAVAAAYFLALASKENGITLPALLVGYHLYRSRSIRGMVREALASWRVWSAMAVSLAGYFAIRKINIGVFLGTESPPWFWGMPGPARVLTAIRVWPEYLRLMLVPVELVPDYGPGVIIPETHLFAPLVLAGLLTAAVVLYLAWRLRRAAPLVPAGIGWFVATVLPVMGLLFPVGIILAERTLYLPSIGLSLAVVPLATWGIRRSPEARRAVLAATLLVLGLGAARTWTATPVWRDSETVLTYLMHRHPANYRAQWATASTLVAQGDTAGALSHFELATRMVPGYYNLRTRYGHVLSSAGRYREAVAQLDSALMTVPEGLDARLVILRALLADGQDRRALDYARDGMAYNPDDPNLNALLARALARNGLYQDAVRARQRSVELDSREITWFQWGHLAGIALLAGDTATSREALRRAAEAGGEAVDVPSLARLDSLIQADGPGTIPLW